MLFTLGDLINEFVITLKQITYIPNKNFAVPHLEKVEWQISQIIDKAVKIGRKYFFMQIKF